MGKGYNHFDDCPCGWCNNFGRNHSLQETRYLEELFERRRKLNNAFSLTIPNAKCPICQAEVFYYENIYGSKVFFDLLGKPWPKHGCFYDIGPSPELNTNEIKTQITYPSNYYPVKPFSYCILKEGYMLIEFIDKEGQPKKYLIKYDRPDFGICFFENKDGGEYLSGYTDKEFFLECYELQVAKQRFPNIFPYKIGSEIEIEICNTNDKGVRTEIFIDRKITLNENKVFRAFIYNAELKPLTRKILEENGKVKVKAKSHLNRDNEIIFLEV